MKFENNPGISSFELLVDYDADKLELVDKAEGDFSGVTFGNALDVRPYPMVWSGGTQNNIGSVAGTLKFKVKNDASETARINISYGEEPPYNTSEQEVQFELINGTVTIKSDEPPITEYTVIWLNGDGSELDRKTYQQGQNEPTTDKTPTKAEDANYTYTFSGWDSGTTSGTVKTYTPNFNREEKQQAAYTVIWLNGDGSELDRKTYQQGQNEPATDKTPTKAEDANYTYTFSGWNAGIVSGTTKTYTPIFVSYAKNVSSSSRSSSSSSGVATYSITTSSGIGGSVKANVKSSRGGKTITLQVEPNDGYELQSLKVEDSRGNDITVKKETDTEYTFTMPYRKVTVTADFQSTATLLSEPVVTYAVTVNSGRGSGDYAEGASVTIVANAPESGKQFKEWSGVNGLTFTSGSVTTANATFTMPARDVTVIATYEDIPPAIIFTDVSENAFYYDAVLWATEKGITNGKSDTLFDPAGICTRAQTVTFLWRAAGSPEPVSNENPFSDISENAYFYKAVLWAVEQGITKGTTATTFSPGNTVSRAQVVTFLYRSANSPSTGSGNNPFTDVPQNSYYNSAVTWASETGVTQGRTSTTFNPSENCNRGQIVTFLYRHFVK